MDCDTPGFSVLHYLPVKWKMFSRVRLFVTHGLYSQWNSPGQNTGVGSLSLLQGVFPTQRSNPGLLHCRQILYQLSHKRSPGISQGLLKFMSIESVMYHLILCHPLLLLPSTLPSIRVFSNEVALHIRSPKCWSLISFRIDWIHFAVQETLKSLLQHQFESINSSALSLLYGPNLTSIHDYWKSHSSADMDFCQQSDVSAF